MELNKARVLFLYLAQKMTGDRGLQIAAAILSNGFLSSEQLSEITGLPITSVRSIVETLRNLGLLYMVTEKDDSGWTIYYYGTDPLAVYRVFKDRLKQAIRNLKRYAEYSVTGSFYKCPECGIKLSRDVAEMEDYKCPVCGAELIKAEPILGLSDLVDLLIEKYKHLSLV